MQAREKAVGDFSSPLLVNEVIQGVAEGEGVPLLPAGQVFRSWQRENSRSHYLEDLIYDECHPNPKGSALIVEGVVQLALERGLLPGSAGDPVGSSEQP